MSISSLILIGFGVLALGYADSWLKSALADVQNQSLYKVTRIPFYEYEWAFKNLEMTKVPLIIQAFGVALFILGMVV